MYVLPETPMLDDGEEGGVRLWHLVKASEESELPKHRRGSLRERGGERAKAIPEIYLTRLLSMKVTDDPGSFAVQHPFGGVCNYRLFICEELLHNHAHNLGSVWFR